MTDISVQIVDSSKDLVAGVPFPKVSENDSDPLAIHEDVKVNDGDNEVDKADLEETVSWDENVKEDCMPEKQNGSEGSVLEKESDHANEETLVTQIATQAINEVETADTRTLDPNAPTPDLPDQFSENSPNNNEFEEELEAPKIHLKTDIVPEENPEAIDEIEEKLKEIESPMQIETTLSVELPKSEKESTPEKDLVKENKIVVESSVLHKEIDNDVEMKEDQSSSSVEEKLSEYTISEETKNDTVPEEISLEKTEEDTEKGLIVPEKFETGIEKIQIVSVEIESISEKIETIAEKTDCTLGKTEIVPEVTEKESFDTTEIVSSETKGEFEKTIPVQDKTEIVQTDKEKVLEKVETVPTPVLEKEETIEEPSIISQVQNETVADKTEVTEKLQTAAEKPEKMDVDTDKVEVVSDKLRVRNFESMEMKPSKSGSGHPVNGDISKDDRPAKRRASDDVDESPLKKLCQEVERNFPHHDSMINEYIQCTTKNNIDEIQKHSEQLLAEIQTLRELAQKKEQEWNNILHLKKVREEILLRLLRRKQVLSFEKSLEINGSISDRADPFDYLNQSKNLAIDKSDEISGLSIKQPGSSSVLRQTISPINPIQSLQNAMAPVMPVPSHFNPMSGLPPPYDKAAAAHMQSMSNNLQNMTNSMQNMSNNMQNMSNSIPNMGNSMPNMASMANSMQNLQNMSKPVYQPIMMPGPMQGFPRDINAMNGQMPGNFGMPMGRQGPTKDVKSIIADYRQRNPEITPRRGRRMKSILNPNMMNAPRNLAPKDMNSLSNLNMLFNNLDMNQKAMLERLQQLQAGGLHNSIFKDALVQFANMQQANAGLIHNTRPMEAMPVNRPEHPPKERRRAERPPEDPPKPERPPSGPRLPPPPPYPEISLLPVTTQESQHPQSLLHGILTKPVTPTSRPVSSSPTPTLAQLLTSPDRERTLPLYGQAKNCGEITITPVQPAAAEQPPEKTEEVVQLDDEESPAPSESEAADSPATAVGGGGRLVIDESAPEEPPLCQGCRRRDAQFVCAGCANQWYCSRDCQVAAWDEHSEMCSG